MRSGSRCLHTWPHKLHCSNKDSWSKESVWTENYNKIFKITEMQTNFGSDQKFNFVLCKTDQDLWIRSNEKLSERVSSVAH